MTHDKKIAINKFDNGVSEHGPRRSFSLAPEGAKADAGTGGAATVVAQSEKRTSGLARRFVVSVIPAAAITTALVLGMNALISVDEIELDESEPRILTKITPTEVSDPAVRQVRIKPKPIHVANTPPPPPRYTVGDGEIDFAPPIIPGAVPKDLDLSGFEGIKIGPVGINDTDAQPVRPPVLSYPRKMAEKGIQGTCEVRFDVAVDGTPYNVKPNCSHTGFEREARRAMNKVQFIPKVRMGQRVERKNVVYPLEFRLGDL